MKIMQVITLSELGGAQSVVINLANELCKNHEVIVVAGNNDGKMWPLLLPEVKAEQIESLSREISLSDITVFKELKRLYKKYKPDIVHLHSSKIGFLGRLAFPKSKTVYTVHGFDSIRLAHRKFLILEKLLKSRCKAIVGVSEYDLKTLHEENINRNVTRVYNGVFKKESTDTSNPFNLDGYEKTILTIARLAKPKRYDIFLDVARLIPNYAFVWIGNKEDVPEHPSNVFFMGNIPDAGRFAKFADLFFLPSNYEGLPIVILESMSHGLPVVASDVGGVSEIVINDYNGYSLPNSPELFADKIRYILENEDVLKRFSENSESLYNEKFTVDKMVEQYYNIYVS